MHTVSLKHALSAGLLAALLAVAAPVAARAAQTPVHSASAAQTPVESGGAAQAPAETSGAAQAPAETGGAAPTLGSAHGRTMATWYGPGFYGHTTACGQRLTPKLVGLASRTLPCGTLVRISFHGHLLTAPVLDRGPYGKSGAMWDLTWGAARALEIKETVHIGTQVVGSVPNTPTLGEPLSATLSPATPASSEASPAPLASSSAATGGASAS